MIHYLIIDDEAIAHDIRRVLQVAAKSQIGGTLL